MAVNKFRGTARARIRNLASRLRQIQAADGRERVQATAKGRVPLLFASTQGVTNAITTLLNRCDAALALRA